MTKYPLKYKGWKFILWKYEYQLQKNMMMVIWLNYMKLLYVS